MTAAKLDGDMSTLLIVAVCILALYAAFVVALIVAGRGRDVRDVARFVPDCIVLFRRLIGDARVPRRKKAVLVVLIGYLALPFDLVPDFIPVAGYLDDAVIVGFALRHVLRGADATLIEELWPGPRESLDLILRIAGAPLTASSDAARKSNDLAR